MRSVCRDVCKTIASPRRMVTLFLISCLVFVCLLVISVIVSEGPNRVDDSHFRSLDLEGTTILERLLLVPSESEFDRLASAYGFESRVKKDYSKVYTTQKQLGQCSRTVTVWTVQSQGNGWQVECAQLDVYGPRSRRTALGLPLPSRGSIEVSKTLLLHRVASEKQ